MIKETWYNYFLRPCVGAMIHYYKNVKCISTSKHILKSDLIFYVLKSDLYLSISTQTQVTMYKVWHTSVLYATHISLDDLMHQIP